MNEQLRGITGDILLEAGTNEFEVLVFRLGDQSFGVNVAKVREVVQPQPVIEVPYAHSSVDGLIKIRGSVLTLIDLRRHLGVAPAANTDEPPIGSVVITEFNGVRIGFKVDAVDRIHRISWSLLLPVPKVSFRSAGGDEAISATTGVIDIDGTLVLLVDFESVADAVLMEQKLLVSAVDNPMGVDRPSKRIIIAEDSPFMRNQIMNVMRTSGYARTEVYPDGESAWNALIDEGPEVHAVVSDIEMPRMDGLHLTRRIKEHPRLKQIPVVLFSSLISDDNANKGQQVGATVQIPKPELPQMVRLVDRIVSGEPLDQTNVGALSLAA